MASLRKRGNSWQVQVRKLGHLSQTRTFHIKAHAVAWGRKVESEIERQLISPHHRPISMELSAAIDRYIREYSVRKKSHIQERNRLRRLARLPLGKLAIANITPKDIANLRDCRLKEVGTQAVRHDLNALSQVFTTAIREWEIGLQQNPVANVRKPPVAAARQRRLNKDEKHRFIHALRKTNDDIRDMILVALNTGMRKGEILRVRKEDVEFEQQTLIIPITKNGHPRAIPLCSGTLAILAKRSATFTELLFPFDEPWCRYHWRKLLLSSGIHDFHFHDLRHEAITRFFENGLNVPEVALISGHKDTRMLFRYTHLRAQDIAHKMHSFALLGRSADYL